MKYACCPARAKVRLFCGVTAVVMLQYQGLREWSLHAYCEVSSNHATVLMTTHTHTTHTHTNTNTHTHTTHTQGLSYDCDINFGFCKCVGAGCPMVREHV